MYVVSGAFPAVRSCSGQSIASGQHQHTPKPKPPSLLGFLTAPALTELRQILLISPYAANRQWNRGDSGCACPLSPCPAPASRRSCCRCHCHEVSPTQRAAPRQAPQRQAAPRSPRGLPQEQLLEEGWSGTRRTAPLPYSGVMRDAPVFSERTDVRTCNAIGVLNFDKVPPQTPRKNTGRFRWSRPELVPVEKKKQPCRKMESGACRTNFYKSFAHPTTKANKLKQAYKGSAVPYRFLSGSLC